MISTQQQTKLKIVETLCGFAKGDTATGALKLLYTLGYRSDKRLDLTPNTPEHFIATFNGSGQLNPGKALIGEWDSVDLLFQLTGEEITLSPQLHFVFETGKRVDNSIIDSYLFFALHLKSDYYTRGQLAGITREINKLFPMPVMVFFQHGKTITLSVIKRRLHKRDESKDVLEKVTLIKDISLTSTHRAHVEILFDLSLAQLYDQHHFTNFVELHRAWQKTLDSSELNKRFFREIANWYFWAIKNVTFPSGAGKDEETRNATSVIRLITRLIFVWFLKEKGLVPEDLFSRPRLDEILNFTDRQNSTYYKAILQNLFFATLNQEMNSHGKRDKRCFRRDGQNYNVTTLYRYEHYFKNPDQALELFATIPFLNGGLFDCLDKPDKNDPKKVIRVDGFSDRPDNELAVPDSLFFSEERDVDLNDIYDTKNKHYRTSGLINIFDSYKFTVEENTPIEEEVALDPELLGKVFENLLAAYNPETGVPARKQTGSFYTPREIVDYMVDESLIAYLQSKLFKSGGNADGEEREVLDLRLRHLLSYSEEPHKFSEAETADLIEAIDTVKILDPACGSGAFPMGILHKLVFILAKLDPGNQRWKQKQIAKAAEIPDSVVRERVISDIEYTFGNNELDYGRKLYLLENCIYGMDIQPIAVQIAKLRCFISLVVDQRTDTGRENSGIRPLPNLETKFVAANALLSVKKLAQLTLRNTAVETKERELAEVRRNHFIARTPNTKAKYREQDAVLRADISALLKQDGLPWDTTEKLAYWDPYDQNASADFFDPEWMFGITVGFDITIGNPPYVRADSGETHLALRRTIEATGQYETLWEKWDLYIPFIERAFKLLKPGGFTTMIVSDAYCHSKYAQKSQNWFLQNSCIHRLDFFSQIQIFDAAVRNITYLFEKRGGSNNRPERRVHDPEFGSLKLLPSDEQRRLNYRVFFPEDTPTPSFRLATIPLANICYITKGMVVSADEREAQGAFEMSDLVSDTKDSLHPKPFVEGKHLACWLPFTHKWLEWGTHRAPALFSRPTFPQIYEVNQKILVQRSPGPDPKACYDDEGLHFTESTVGFVLWTSLKGIRNNSLKKAARYRNEKPRHDLPRREDLENLSRRFDAKFLVAVMNSTAARDFLRANRRSNIHLYPDDWKKLPVPDATPEQQAPLIKLVDEILAVRRANPAADVTELEAEIDKAVNQLYGLTGDQVEFVEEAILKK